MKFIKIIGLLLFVILAGCANNDNERNSESEIKIFTTIYPLQFIVEEIAGDTMVAETVYPPGVDEHTYEPTSKDITDIADGEAFIYIGAGLEAFASTAAGALENQDVELIEIGKHEELFISSGETDDHEDESHQHDHGDLDPHIWLDPLRMIDIAEIVTDELIEINPDGKVLYEENLAALKDEFTKLDSEFQQVISSKTNKKVLVTHAAFGYWEERYGLEQIAIHGISTENEPSQKSLIEIIETANEYGIKHVIYEQNVTTRVSEIIQDEIGAESLIIHNLSVLTEEDIAEERDYFSIMRDNLEVLDEAMN